MISAFSLSGKVAIVTGAGQGIGEATALALAEAGAHVAIAELDPAKAEKTADEVRQRGRKALAVYTDVRLSAQVQAMADRVLKEFGKIDILVNNAGGILGITGPVLQTTEADWERGIALNLKGVFLCCRTVGKVMVAQQRGVIVNVASFAGMVPYTPAPHYGAAKAAVINLTQTLAQELAPQGVRVNAVAPGTTETPLVLDLFRVHPEIREQRLKSIPLGRLGRPEDIAFTVVYLCSSAADYITGEVIPVKGGLQSSTP